MMVQRKIQLLIAILRATFSLIVRPWIKAILGNIYFIVGQLF